MDREGSNEPRNALNRQDSAVTNKNSNAGSMAGPIGISPEHAAEIERINANRVGTSGTMYTQGGTSNNAANETKDAITGRIIHTVNMMKEVL